MNYNERLINISSQLLGTTGVIRKENINIASSTIFGETVKIADKKQFNDIGCSKIKEEREKYIITEDGLFYANFSDYFKVELATNPESGYYSENLVWLKERYGIRIGKPQASRENFEKNGVGVYIINCKDYLRDQRDKKNHKNKILSKGYISEL